ncbi:TRAP transporter small permease subunit [Qingshengfaniella alkalisoli]|uniref:TRAP transporter small permease protein n=1 Tax=Qingshengfaniella alkalisoli TaxID=2599296 RepID=A0A5B8IXU9_9RHOB|nr:TRAP transporter small permease subunit [Qingshengfaniella alkalisoli]QDY70564.1 TRAP transporter small permease [Qingshengfaniella alkalisoli]
MSKELPDGSVPQPPDVLDTARRTLPEAGLLGRWIGRMANVFAIGIVLAMCVLVLEVVMRYCFNAPTAWAHETSTFLSSITFIFGGLFCVARNSHIRVVLVYDLIHGRNKRLLNAVISLICFISSAFFVWAATIMVKKSLFRPNGDLYLETSGSAWNPPTPGLTKVFLFCVLVVMSVQFLILAINYLRRPASHASGAR